MRKTPDKSRTAPHLRREEDVSFFELFLFAIAFVVFFTIAVQAQAQPLPQNKSRIKYNVLEPNSTVEEVSRFESVTTFRYSQPVRAGTKPVSDVMQRFSYSLARDQFIGADAGFRYRTANQYRENYSSTFHDTEIFWLSENLKTGALDDLKPSSLLTLSLPTSYDTHKTGQRFAVIGGLQGRFALPLEFSIPLTVSATYFNQRFESANEAGSISSNRFAHLLEIGLVKSIFRDFFISTRLGLETAYDYVGQSRSGYYAITGANYLFLPHATATLQFVGRDRLVTQNEIFDRDTTSVRFLVSWVI